MTRWWFVLCAMTMACHGPEDRRSPGAAGAPSSKAPSDKAPVVVLQPVGGAPAQVAVELARTEAERAKGLMFRRTLGPDDGMLFLFQHDEVQTFWMKNTYLPLDMIFIAADLTVVGVVENAEPLTLSPRTVGIPSMFVLEVNAGWARTKGITAGTPVVLRNVPLEGLAP